MITFCRIVLAFVSCTTDASIPKPTPAAAIAVFLASADPLLDADRIPLGTGPTFASTGSTPWRFPYETATDIPPRRLDGVLSDPAQIYGVPYYYPPPYGYGYPLSYGYPGQYGRYGQHGRRSEPRVRPRDQAPIVPRPASLPPSPPVPAPTPLGVPGPRGIK